MVGSETSVSQITGCRMAARHLTAGHSQSMNCEWQLPRLDRRAGCRISSACLAVARGAALLCASARSLARSFAPRGRSPFALCTPAQRVHQVDDIALLARGRRLDFFSLVFLADQFLQRILVLVLELVGMEMATFGLDNVRG